MIHLNIGSNLDSKLGNRFENISIAINLLINSDLKINKVSNFYETPSYPNKKLPHFLNVGVMGNFKFDETVLIKKIDLIEKKIGRIKNKKNDPRVCDIDIIDFNGLLIETENLKLCVPSKDNLPLWSKWINSTFVRKTLASTKIPKTIDMQWNWIESELNSEKRILLEICDKNDNTFLGVVSLSSINYKRRSAQIATISPQIKNKKNRYCVYEARIAISKYAFQELSLNKVYGAMEYPKNDSFMVLIFQCSKAKRLF